MAGEIISVVAQATSQSSWVDSAAFSSVSESDAARLSDLMSTQQVQAQAPDGAAAPGPASPQGPGKSMGDAILRSMDATGRNYKAKIEEMNLKLANPQEMTTSDLLRMQFQLIDTSMQVDLISKAISKGTQHIDQLTKLQ